MDPRAAATPSIRNFAHAIDRQRQRLERIPLLESTLADVAAVARALDDAEAAALAIAGGDLSRLAAVAAAVSIPVLRADALAEEYRIYESRTAGADAVFFRAASVPQEMLTRLVQAASSTHMAACVACASDEEVARAAAARAPVIALPPALLHLSVPPRTLVLALSFSPEVRGHADAALDPSLVDADSLRRALSEEDS